MKLTVEDLYKYSYCPKLYEQAKDLKLESQDVDSFAPLIVHITPVQECFDVFLIKIFRKEIERHSKLSFEEALSVWSKLYKPKDSKAYNKSIIHIKSFYDWYTSFSYEALSVNHNIDAFLYGYTLTGVIPVLLFDPSSNGVFLVLTSHKKISKTKLKYLSLFLQEELNSMNILGAMLISFYDNSFSFETILFNTRFFEDSVQDFLGVAQSINEGLTYPNYAACNSCPIEAKCKARKVNV